MTDGLTCWVVTDGKRGTENQCLGLAAALGVTPVIKRITPRRPWALGLPHFRLGLRWALDPSGDQVAPPWPRLLISSGRQSLAAALWIKRQAGDAVYWAHIQDPKMRLAEFDLVITPRHDRLSGANVMLTEGALHRVTPHLLSEQSDLWRDRLAHLPAPRLAVLIGGNSGAYVLDAPRMGEIADMLHDLAEQGTGLMVTTSRRSGEDNQAILSARLSGHENVHMWDGEGDNPIFGYLGLCDRIAVTADSVSMLSEAASTGKPVHVIDLEGGSAKFHRFHDRFAQLGITRPLQSPLPESWGYDALQETADAAARIRSELQL
ncbi:MAG: mitochondrial fission ELM1 family protein [Alphaproteobacteria bacterium]